MKTIVPAFIIAAVLTACSNHPEIAAPQAVAPVNDTAGFAEFQRWKNIQENQKQTAGNAVYAVKHVPENRPRPAPASAPVYTSPTTTEPASSDIPGAAESQQNEKKGWSKAAKGAAIGAGSGAVLGAVIHKRNRVVGGVVGGAVGAGVGYGIGRHIDKKDGRY